MKCKHENTVVILRPDTTHYAELRCADCGKFLKWIPAPKNEGRRTQSSRYSIEDVTRFHGFDTPFCFFCLRKKEELGKNETLTIDHIKEIHEGGEDKLENLQILCSACHKLKNWSRLYMNWHFNNQEVVK